MSTCYKTSDNKYFGCPPRMADGRHFTDYRPSCDMNSVIKVDNNIRNSLNYRLFLQENAEKLLEINRKYSCQKNCCEPCKEGFETTMLPEKYTQLCNKNSCIVVGNDPKGLGLGRNYNSVDNLKGDNAGSNPLANGKNICGLPYDNFSYYGFNEGSNLENVQRNTIPAGGIPMSGGDNSVRQ